MFLCFLGRPTGLRPVGKFNSGRLMSEDPAGPTTTRPSSPWPRQRPDSSMSTCLSPWRCPTSVTVPALGSGLGPSLLSPSSRPKRETRRLGLPPPWSKMTGPEVFQCYDY